MAPRGPQQNSAPGARSGSLLDSTLWPLSLLCLRSPLVGAAVCPGITSHLNHFTQILVLGSGSGAATKDLWENSDSYLGSSFFVLSICLVAWGAARGAVIAVHKVSSRDTLSSLQHVGLVTLRCMGSSFLSQRSNHVPSIGRRILNHWTTREVAGISFKEDIPGLTGLSQPHLHLLQKIKTAAAVAAATPLLAEC